MVAHEGTRLQELENNVIHWAKDRNLIRGSTAIAQLSKTLEECGELLASLQAQQSYDPEKRGHDLEQMISFAQKNTEETVDAYGDILVTLIIGMRILGLDMKTCLEQAYNDIKDRKGKMIDGVFVKDS